MNICPPDLSALSTFHLLPITRQSPQFLPTASIQSHLKNSQHVFLVAIKVVIQLWNHILRSANQAFQNL